MSKKHRWFWILLFITITALLFGLATEWNVVLVRDYRFILGLAKKLPKPPEFQALSTSFTFRMAVGTLGFCMALALTVLIFVKLLHEMRFNQQQSEFLAIVSHELKTPITALELTSGLLRTQGLSRKQNQLLWEAHQKELHRLQEEVQTLLEAAGWQSHTPRLQLTLINLEEWLQESWSGWQSLLGPGFQFIRKGTPLTVLLKTDLRALNRVMNNLLSNAKKFSQDQPEVTLETQLFQKKSLFYWDPKVYWQIQVKDQGWGFHPQDAKKIFQRFYRSPATAPDPIPGTGLGLYLAYTMSQALKINLSAESQGKGQGARFILTGAANHNPHNAVHA